MTTEAATPDSTAPRASQRRRELRTADGRLFRAGDEVLYHASLEPDHPLVAARVETIVQVSRGPAVLVLNLEHPEGTRFPDASCVHLDQRPLAGCQWCAERDG